MKARQEILAVLEKNGYPTDEKAQAQVQQLLECLKDENKFATLTQILAWFTEQKNRCATEITEISLNDLQKWQVNKETGNIEHESGEFFTVMGVRISNSTQREVFGWTQPMIKQKEGGILGILCQPFEGIRHYLIYAKMEPGNMHKLQLSPTLQATYSNLKKAHGGKKPKFAEYFEDAENNPKVKVLYSQWLAEDGGRFYLKANKNMLVEISEQEKIEVPSDYIWLTMYQIKQLLRYDNLVNPHLRSVIAHL